MESGAPGLRLSAPRGCRHLCAHLCPLNHLFAQKGFLSTCVRRTRGPPSSSRTSVPECGGLLAGGVLGPGEGDPLVSGALNPQKSVPMGQARAVLHATPKGPPPGPEGAPLLLPQRETECRGEHAAPSAGETKEGLGPPSWREGPVGRPRLTGRPDDPRCWVTDARVKCAKSWGRPPRPPTASDPAGRPSRCWEGVGTPHGALRIPFGLLCRFPRRRGDRRRGRRPPGAGGWSRGARGRGRARAPEPCQCR